MGQANTSSTQDSNTRSFALRFISGKYQGGEFPLPLNGEIVIGRSSELDMVLVEDMVSRRHAKISVAGSKITIQDLESTNGTFVNGEKVTLTELHEGDRILIGTNIIKLVVSEHRARRKSNKSMQDSNAERRRTSQVRTMAGSLGEVPLTDLLQLFSASKKTGVLTVRTDHEEGKIYLQNGKMVFASLTDDESVTPLKVLYRVLGWSEGTFEMAPAENAQFENPIDLPTEAILMEAMRQLDEYKRLEPDLPSMDATLAIAHPLRAPLKSLSPSELEIFELIYNHSKFTTVLNKSSQSDLDTYEAIIKLIKGGYITAKSQK